MPPTEYSSTGIPLIDIHCAFTFIQFKVFSVLLFDVPAIEFWEGLVYKYLTILKDNYAINFYCNSTVVKGHILDKLFKIY